MTSCDFSPKRPLCLRRAHVATKDPPTHGTVVALRLADAIRTRTRRRRLDRNARAHGARCRVGAREDVNVEIAWSVKFNESLEGVYKVVSEGNAYVFTQFEAISARNSIPCFDEPGIKTPFTVAFNIPEGMRIAGNTREARSNEVGG